MSTASLRPYLGYFVAQLTASGVQHAIIAPGSRSTPLALLLREHPEVTVTVALDERSAAFFALGLAKASHQPVVVLCSSGTAAANFYPAVAEASLSRVPLIIITADRPRELRDVGAAQTIDQVHLFGSHVKWFQDLPTPGLHNPSGHAAQVGARAVHRAMTHPRGPVHLNFPLREPLMPEPGPIAPALMGPQFAPQMMVSNEALWAAQSWIEPAKKPILVLGPEAPLLPAEVIEQCVAKHWPVFVDPLAKNGRQGPVLTAYDTALRRSPKFAPPDLVVRLGSPMTSKVFNQWSADARLILLDWPGGFRDPDHLSSLVIEGDPALALSRILEESDTRSDDYLSALQAAEADAERRIEVVLEDSPEHFEGRFYAQIDRLWGPRHKPVLVASSMPIRDLDTFYRRGHLTIYGNRGANGIDGLNSTALGIARHDGDVLAVLGDLAFHHDLTGLIYGQQYAINALIVVINNTGGAIFSYLPQSTLDHDRFEELFGTPHHVDFSGVATLYGAEYRRADNYQDFAHHFLQLREQPGLRVLEWLTTPRSQSVAIHRQLYRHGDLS